MRDMSHPDLVRSVVNPPCLARFATEETRRAAELLPDILSANVAPSSGGRYSSAWRRFSDWCIANGRLHLPASVETVSLYLAVCSLRTQTIAPAYAARSAIGFYHKMAYLESTSPTDSVRIAQVIKGLKRKFAKPVVKKRPITPLMAKALLSLYTSKGLENMDLMELRSAAFFSVLYFCCTRYEEAAKLKLENVSHC